MNVDDDQPVVVFQPGRSRAVASVNHLEIPAELAFVLSKMDNWEPLNTEKNLAKVSGQVPDFHFTWLVKINIMSFLPKWKSQNNQQTISTQHQMREGIALG